MNRKDILYYLILVLIIGYIVRDAVGVFFNPDPANVSVLLFQFFLLFLIILRGQYTSVGIIGWSILFLTKNAISAASVLLEHGHNEFTEIDTFGILKPFLKIAIGGLVWVIAIKIPLTKKINS